MGRRSVTKLFDRLTTDRTNRGSDDSNSGISGHGSTALALTRSIRQPYRLPSLVSTMTNDDLLRLSREVQDYLLVSGGFLKIVPAGDHDFQPSVSGQSFGVSLHPSPLPRRLFEDACGLQTAFQRLYVAVSHDADWLHGVLKDMIATDPLTRVLWSIFEQTRTAKAENSRSDVEIAAGIFRSDYMMHASSDQSVQLKQVELNTIACAGAAHGDRVNDMHRYLYSIGAYATILNSLAPNPYANHTMHIPYANNVRGICATLEKAHKAYVQSYCSVSCAENQLKTCVLMVVQPRNFNVADERPIEYALWALDPPIPCFRIEWGRNMIELTSLSSAGNMVFRPPHLRETYTVAVIYYRAGFEDREYVGQNSPIGFEARKRFETSNAAKCPNVLTHLAGSKKVQQALCVDGALERFLPPTEAQILRKHFMNMYPLDQTKAGEEGKRLATDVKLANGYVLKPNREGGGHNHYREELTTFLRKIPQFSWSEYVLMELIEPVVSQNTLVSVRGTWSGDVVAELGIWGGCVWKGAEKQPEMFANSQIGWSVRSKNPNVDEMSVVKGYGCFDSITLVENDIVDEKEFHESID